MTDEERTYLDSVLVALTVLWSVLFKLNRGVPAEDVVGEQLEQQLGEVSGLLYHSKDRLLDLLGPETHAKISEAGRFDLLDTFFETAEARGTEAAVAEALTIWGESQSG